MADPTLESAWFKKRLAMGQSGAFAYLDYLSGGIEVLDLSGNVIFRTISGGDSNTGITLVDLMRLTVRSAPASPSNGDVWMQSDGLYGKTNGAVFGPLKTNMAAPGPIGGSTPNTIACTTLTATGLILTPASADVAGAGFRLPHGIAPNSPTNGDFWTTSAGVFVRVNGVTKGPLVDSGGSLAWASPGTIGSSTPNTGAFTALSATGLIQTRASASGGASINIPQGVAPSSPNNGDVWITSGGLYARINGVTYGPYYDSALVQTLLASPSSIGLLAPAAGKFTALTSTGLHQIAASVVGGAGINLSPGVAPSAPNNGDVWVTAAGIYVRINGVTWGPLLDSTNLPWGVPGAIGLSVPNQGYFTGLTMSGPIYCQTSGGGNLASLRIPHGSAPATPVNGDTWTTTLGMYQYINGVIVGPYISAANPGNIGTGTPGTGAFTAVSASGQITSTVATGTPPLVIASSTNVPNLNASTLGGATFAAPGAIGGSTPGAITATSVGVQALTSSLNTYSNEMIVAGNMESTSPALATWWVNYSTPATSQQDSGDKHAGTYSWKIVTNGTYQGVQQQLPSLANGCAYQISFWMHISTLNSGQCGCNITSAKNFGGTSIAMTGPITNTSGWFQVTTTFTPSQDWPTPWIVIYGTVSGMTFYIYDVSLQKCQGVVTANGVCAANDTLVVQRALSLKGRLIAANGDTTPSVASGQSTSRLIGASTGTTTITNFTGGTEGQILIVQSGGGTGWTIPNGTYIKTASTWTPDAGGHYVIKFMYDAVLGVWLELSSSNNGA